MKTRLSLLLCLIMALFLFPVVASASEVSQPHTHCVCATDTGSVDGHPEKAHSSETVWTGVSGLSDIKSAGYYYLMNDVETNGSWYPVDGVILCLNGHNIICTKTSTAIGVYSTFTLTDCKANVGKVTHSNSAGGSGVLNYGTFNMYGGSISNNTGNGVASDGTFNMYGGIISNNSSGVSNLNSFTLYDGIISNNFSSSYGGGVYNNYKTAKFTMNGGSISDNRTQKIGGGIYNGSDATFTMNGGSISNNKAQQNGGGIYNDSGATFTMNDYGSIGGNESASCGGGVYNDGTFTMNSGGIHSNISTGNAPLNGGGGVYNDTNGTFTFGNRSICFITNNKATGYSYDSIGGGAVYNYGKATCTMKSGMISDNYANNGGGVFNYSPDSDLIGTVNLCGSTIKNNTAISYGGGVYNRYNEFIMSAGSITENSAKANGGGVYISESSSITLSGRPKITRNTVDNADNNVFLTNSMKLYAGGLTTGANIGVTSDSSPDSSGFITITNDQANKNYFMSDNSFYQLDSSSDGKVMLVTQYVSVPVPSNYTYDGTAHTGIALGDNYVLVSGTNTASNAGDYTVSIKPTNGKMWADGTTTAKEITWKIDKADLTANCFSINSSETTWDGNDKTASVSVSATANALNIDASKITIQYTQGSETVTPNSVGTYSVLASYSGDDNINAVNGLYIGTFNINHPTDHKWSDSWTSDGTEHWLVCTVPGCADKGNIASHEGGKATCTSKAKCTVCDAEYGTTNSEVHSGTISWTTTSEKHSSAWNCCGAIDTPEGYHGWNDIGVCTICGYGCTHVGGTAYCNAQAICEKCNVSYGDYNANNHTSGTELKNKKDATHTEDGYTGDTYCVGCGEKLSSGERIIAEGHKGGTATCTDKAVCEICHEAYGDFNPNNHKNLSHFEACNATINAEGNIEYWYCDVCGKYYSDQIAETEISADDTIIQRLTPSIISGNNVSVVKGEKTELTFTANTEFSEFIRAELDNVTIDESYYTKAPGSTIITLNADYVATLSAGTHTLRIVSQNGTATATFSVNEKSEDQTNTDDKNPLTPTDIPKAPSSASPSAEPTNIAQNTSVNTVTAVQTGDNTNTAMWVTILIIGAVAGTTIISKKRNNN